MLFKFIDFWKRKLGLKRKPLGVTAVPSIFNPPGYAEGFQQSSVARQQMFSGNISQLIPPVNQQTNKPVQARVIDCGYVEALRCGFCGTVANWQLVKDSYIKTLSAGNQDPNLVIDCNNILFDGQGIQDADGKWHR